jgi:phenylacetate-CoA ligase
MDPAARVNADGIFEMLMESQHWSENQMLVFQNSQLEQLLRHARKTVPFYAARLEGLFFSNGDINWSNWNNIPILTRNDVAQNFDTLQSTDLPAGHGKTIRVSTTGSTGTPIAVTSTRLLSDVCRAMDWRAHSRWGYDWSKPLVYWHSYEPKYAKFGPRHDYGPWGPKSRAKGVEGKSYVADNNSPLNERLAHLEQVGANYLFSQGNFPAAAALTMIEKQRFQPLHTVQSHGIGSDLQFADCVKRAFGAKLVSLYSSKEGGRLAHQCAQCDKYHVNVEMVHLEILDENNQPCAPGKPGRVVITNFYNAAQPFIRYEQGDIATWSNGCVCGSKLPTLERIDGRVYHLFRRRNGEVFAPQVVDSLRDMLQATLWQFTQTTPNTVLVKYKPSNERSEEREARFASELRGILQEDYAIQFECINDLPVTSTGKFLKYIYAVNVDTAPIAKT